MLTVFVCVCVCVCECFHSYDIKRIAHENLIKSVLEELANSRRHYSLSLFVFDFSAKQYRKQNK